MDIVERLRRSCDPLNPVWRHDRDKCGIEAADEITTLRKKVEMLEQAVASSPLRGRNKDIESAEQELLNRMTYEWQPISRKWVTTAQRLRSKGLLESRHVFSSSLGWRLARTPGAQ